MGAAKRAGAHRRGYVHDLREVVAIEEIAAKVDEKFERRLLMNGRGTKLRAPFGVNLLFRPDVFASGRSGVVRLSRAAAEGRWTAVSSSCGGRLRPQVRSVAAELAEGGPGDQMTLVIVGVGYGCVSGEEALG